MNQNTKLNEKAWEAAEPEEGDTAAEVDIGG